MKDVLKKSWWKVLAYCVVASLISFRLKVRIGPHFAINRLPDGTVSVDNTRWMIMSVCIFLVLLIVGGLLFFRRMKKKEVFYSASVMVAVNAIGSLISYFTQRTSIGASFGVYFSELTDWSGAVSAVLYNVGLNQWLVAVFAWSVPYLFVLFGKKDIDTI